MITKNHRIGVTHRDRRTWFLHIKEVRESDRGWYMCQINTDPMKSQVGYIEIVGKEKKKIVYLLYEFLITNSIHIVKLIFFGDFVVKRKKKRGKKKVLLLLLFFFNTHYRFLLPL